MWTRPQHSSDWCSKHGATRKAGAHGHVIAGLQLRPFAASRNLLRSHPIANLAQAVSLWPEACILMPLREHKITLRRDRTRPQNLALRPGTNCPRTNSFYLGEIQHVHKVVAIQSTKTRATTMEGIVNRSRNDGC